MYRFTNRRRFITFLLLLIMGWGAVISCKPVYKTLNGVNKTVNFNDRSAYLNYYVTKYKLDANKIYFIDAQQYGKLMNYLSHEKISYFYGITLNDSTKIDDPFLNEDSSCSGRVLGTIRSERPTKTKRTEISGFELRNQEGSKMAVTNGKSAIFLITTKFGHSVIKEIKRLSLEIGKLNDPDFRYYLISIDGPETYNGFTSVHQP